MCHSLTNGPGGIRYLDLSSNDRIFCSRPMKTGICRTVRCMTSKSSVNFGTQNVLWHHIPRSNFGKFIQLNAQSSPLFLSQTSENNCTDCNIWMSEILLKGTVINVREVASLLCCCLLHLYVTYRFVCEIENYSLRRHCDSPNPADTNGTTGSGNQSSGNPSSSNQNGGSANCGGSNSDGERNPPPGGNGGCDGGSNSGGGGDKDGDKNSDSNLGSDDDGGDGVEERDEEDDDKGNETEEEDIDQEASKENTEPPSQLSLVPEAVIEAAGGMDAIDDDKAKLLVRRLQPIYELVDSEQSYGKKLTFVKEKYIPAVNQQENLQVQIPDDLAQRWRILWGNWIQLYEWHSNFLNKLEGIYQTDPDRIPKLFIDSRARLRSIYSKYCENQRKATLIADQYRDFFDELRVKVGDKEDVQSYLMQPVQRIMRYQLPMGEIVKLTSRANLSSATQWQKALDLMKEIPKDTQMILEAARIDGFTGTITALGNMRIRGDLQVATISRSDFRTRRQLSMRKEKSVIHSGNGPDGTSGLELKFFERRVFLFEQMLLITEEVKSKRKDVFAQSSYLFKNALNVNRMSFEPHWLPLEAEIDLDDDDLKFVVEDTSPQCDAAYVIDPGSVETREQWVIQLRDLQRMQQQLLLALQDPTRYAGSGGGPEADDTAPGEATPSPTSGSGAVSGLRSFLSGDRGASKKHGSSKSGGVKKKKFPSFKKGKQRSKTEELPITLLSPGSSCGGVDGNLDPSNKNTRKESCPNTLSVLINPGEKKQVDSRKGNVGSDVQHQSTAGALISGRASAELQQSNDNIDGDGIEGHLGGSASGQQHLHQPSKKKFSVFNLFGKNKHHHHHHHNQPGTKDQTSASSPTAGVTATASLCASEDLSPGSAVNK